MIDLDRAKAYCVVEHDLHDDLIQGLAEASVATVEAKTGKFLSVKSFTQLLAGFPSASPYAVKLLRGPVDATELTVEYDPGDGGEPVDLGDFRVVEGLRGALLPAYGASWPSTLAGPGTVRVTYSAGFADGEAPDLDQACLMLVAHWYASREAVSANAANEVPMGVEALLRPHMPVGIA